MTLFDFLNTLHPIIQSIIGTAIFAFLIWLGRVLYKVFVKAIKNLRIAYEIKRVTKIIIHKHYVNSNGLYFFTQGYLFILYEAFRHFLKAVIIIAVGFWIYLLFLDDKILLGVFVYIAIQFLIESISWLNPRLSEEDLNKYNEEIVKQTLETLVHIPRKGIGLDSDKIDPNKKLDEIKLDIDKLYHELIGKTNIKKESDG